ncbi:TonB family protein [bacterium]|nr:TonB family protein [bacterium]
MLPLYYVTPRDFALASTGGGPRCASMGKSSRDAFLWSLGMHLVFLVTLVVVTSPAAKKPEVVKVTIVSVPAAIPPKPVPEKSREKRVATERKPSPQAQQTKAVQGIPPDAVTPDATGIAAPIGNTLMTEDEGKRIRPEDYRELAGDLSSDARLILGSVKVPAYTDAALEASLEGNFIVDVYVDESGNVLQCELRKRVGFGMDERLLDAARVAKFKPRKNKLGKAEAGWAEIKFSLVIP